MQLKYVALPAGKMTRYYHFQNKKAYLLSKIDFLAIFIACFASVK